MIDFQLAMDLTERQGIEPAYGATMGQDTLEGLQKEVGDTQELGRAAADPSFNTELERLLGGIQPTRVGPLGVNGDGELLISWQQAKVLLSTGGEASSNGPGPSAGSSGSVSYIEQTPNAAANELDGEISAVEAARRKAQELAALALNHKRDTNDDSEDAIVDPNENSINKQKRRYKRRLRKNRDTAFISRIRRRAYASLLEAALAENEREKLQLRHSVSSLEAEVSLLKAELKVASGGPTKAAMGWHKNDALRSDSGERSSSSEVAFMLDVGPIISPVSLVECPHLV